MTTLLRTFFLLILLNASSMAAKPAANNEIEETEASKDARQKMLTLMREPTEAEQQAMDLSAEWNGQLTDYLLSHEQPYAQAIGLNEIQAIVGVAATKKNEDELAVMRQNYADHINRLVKDETLNIETFQILQSLCFMKELDGYCDRQALLDKQMKLYPTELSVYFMPLQLALQSGNKELTANLMKVMSGAQQISNNHYLLPEFILMVKDYIKANPIPKKALLRSKNDYLALNDLSDKQIALMEVKMPDHQVYIILNTLQMSLPVQSVIQIKNLCQSEPQYSADCLYIAKILIHKSNGIISKVMGRVINLAVYELNNQQDMLAASQANHERFKQYYDCLSKSLSPNNNFNDLFDNDYSDLWLTSEDELVRLNKVASYLYEKRKSEGAKDLVNPETCNVQ